MVRRPLPPRRRSRLPGILAALVAMAVLGGIGYSGWFRHSYGSWPGLDVGDRITWCGHDFHPAVTDLTRSEVDAAAEPQRPIVPAFRYPPVLPQATVLAAMRSSAEQAQEPTVPCAPTLYVPTGPDRFTSYLPDGAE